MSVVVEYGCQKILDHEPAQQEIAELVHVLAEMGCTDITPMIESDFGDTAMYWELTVIGNHEDEAATVPEGVVKLERFVDYETVMK